MLRYKTKTRPGLVALYDIWPGNGAGPFLQTRSPHGASLCANVGMEDVSLSSVDKLFQITILQKFMCLFTIPTVSWHWPSADQVNQLLQRPGCTTATKEVKVQDSKT